MVDQLESPTKMPDLVIEILSPGTSAGDRELKRKRYEHFRVREYWLIDPDANSVETLTLQENRFVRLNLVTPAAFCMSPLFPDFKIDSDLALEIACCSA